MNPTLGRDPLDMLSRVGRHWGWLLAFGILTVVAGLLVVIWPDKTVVAIAVLFGIQLVWTGIFRFVTALALDEASGGDRVLLALLGVLSFIVGLYALRHLNVTVLALAVLLGIFWIVNGAIELFTAIGHREMAGRGWTAVMGLLSIVAGIVVLVYPGISLTTLALVLGFWLVVFGVMEIVHAFQLRSIGRRIAQIAPAT